MIGYHPQFSNIFYGVQGHSPQETVKELARRIADGTGLPEQEIEDKMLSFLQSSMVGIGDGVALFDWVSDELSHAYTFCVHLETPVDFPSLDTQPSGIVLVLISPEKEGPLHLRNLSRLTRFFRNPELISCLRMAESKTGMEIILSSTTNELLAA